MNKFILRKLKITRLKIFIASLLYYVVRLFYKDQQIIERAGVMFEVDLNEGIELHLFLFGSFQKNVLENKVTKIPSDSVILDVGANSGLMTLFFANKIKNGFVHAFEPTDYAFKKLTRNLELNPGLKGRIRINQTFVSSGGETKYDLLAYSSWPIKSRDPKHSIHGGVAMPTENTPSITIDKYCDDQHIAKVSLVKIDTDGHEYEVLKGMRGILSKYRPQIIFEIGIYVLNEREIIFEDYCILFEEFNYQLFTTQGDMVSLENHLSYIPQFGTIDLVAIPN